MTVDLAIESRKWYPPRLSRSDQEGEVAVKNVTGVSLHHDSVPEMLFELFRGKGIFRSSSGFFSMLQMSEQELRGGFFPLGVDACRLTDLARLRAATEQRSGFACAKNFWSR